jgi:hypothetical protein
VTVVEMGNGDHGNHYRGKGKKMSSIFSDYFAFITYLVGINFCEASSNDSHNRREKAGAKGMRNGNQFYARLLAVE